MVNGERVAIFTGTEFDTLALSQLASNGITFGSNSGRQHIILDRGSMLFAPNSDIVVTTKEGDVHIGAGAVALIFEDGHDVAILDLSDRNVGDIQFTGIMNGALTPGRQVVLTRNSQADFNDINPASAVATRRLLKTNLSNDITAYNSEFSIVSALRVGDLYNQLKQTAEGRSVLERILRSAACLQILTFSHGPYTASRTTEQ